MITHLKNNHKISYSQLKISKSTTKEADIAIAPKQPTITGSFSQSQPYPHHDRKWRELTDSVTCFIVKDSLLINTVKKSGFRDMIKKFDSRYDLPSSTYFSRTAIPTLYSNTKQKVAKQLEDVGYFASTTDMWSSVSSKPYISYTIHFINKEWKLQSIALSIDFLPVDHTAIVIAEVLEEILQEWNLNSQKQVSLTTDSGADVVAAANLLNWIRISCFGHILHLAITS